MAATVMQRFRGTREIIPRAPRDPPVRILWRPALTADHQAALAAWGFHYHPDMEFQMVRRGTCAYTVRDQTYLLRPGHLLIIFPNVIHRFKPVAAMTTLEKITFMVKPSLAELQAIGGGAGREAVRHVRLTVDESMGLARIATDIQAEFAQRAEDWCAMCRLCLGQLIILARRAAAHPIPVEASSPAVARALDTVEQRFAEVLTNQDLARAAKLSVGRLTHLFAEHMGVSIRQYVIRYRILKACEILAQKPGLKVEAVAPAVGFKRATDFHRAFKRHTRMTPAEYRASHEGRWGQPGTAHH